jgi:hypothetical protein
MFGNTPMKLAGEPPQWGRQECHAFGNDNRWSVDQKIIWNLDYKCDFCQALIGIVPLDRQLPFARFQSQHVFVSDFFLRGHVLFFTFGTLCPYDLGSQVFFLAAHFPICVTLGSATLL